MMESRTTRRAADHLVDLLVAQGTKQIFGVPGESYLPVLDALHGREAEIQFITCRQESGAAMAAEAHGKLTGRPGVCMVTRGPGATNASAGIHVGFQDSTPMIIFIGQVARPMIEREAFQEIDYRHMFGQMAKWVTQIDIPSRMQEYISRAYRVAMSGRPGPVVVALPEDMLYETVLVPPAPALISAPKFLPSPGLMEALRTKIAQAERPMVIVGGGNWSQNAIEALETFVEIQGLPVAASFRCQGLFNNLHQNYVGHFNVSPTAYLNDALTDSDLLIALGPRLGEITTGGYSLLKTPVPQQTLAHVFPDPNELGRVFEPDLSLVSDFESFCITASRWCPINSDKFTVRTTALNTEYKAFSSLDAVQGDPLAEHFAHLSETLPNDSIVCNGAGNYAAWLHRFYKYRGPKTQLAPTSGSMGYGLPAAIGAAVTAPNREIYVIAGDGCFMMTCQELATAAHYSLNLIVIIINNGRFGTIRAHQEREYPGRVSATTLTNPDFSVFARAFGAHGRVANSLQRFKSELAEARARGGLSLIEVPQDPNFLAPGKTLN